jgi:hypothetical protein
MASHLRNPRQLQGTRAFSRQARAARGPLMAQVLANRLSADCLGIKRQAIAFDGLSADFDKDLLHAIRVGLVPAG